VCVRVYREHYGVATVSRIDKMIGLFCKRALQKRRYSAKEIYNLIDPTDHSHPIAPLVGSDCMVREEERGGDREKKRGGRESICASVYPEHQLHRHALTVR